VFVADWGDDTLVTWALTADGATPTRRSDYAPTFYVGDSVGALYGPGDPPPRTGLSDDMTSLRASLAADRRVVDTDVVRRRQTWRTDTRPVLAVTVADVAAVRPLASRVHERGRPGQFTCYDVDLAPGFRYCLETGTDPTPARTPRTLAVGVDCEGSPAAVVPAVDGRDGGGDGHDGGSEGGATAASGVDHGGGGAGSGPLPDWSTVADVLGRLTCAGDRLVDGAGRDDRRARDRTREALAALSDRIDAVDPDVLVVDTARLVPLVCEAATALGVDLRMGRRPGYRKRAGASTYTSYGRVGHSPARYGVPGRAVVDRSNTFFFSETNLAGCLDLVARSGKPLQELSWASIGNVLTGIQIRAARDRDVLVPWRPWRPERSTPAGTLDEADRGGVTLAPAVGVHEDVHELDFASLYPNVIVTRNLSPETVRCDCCDTDDVPGLGYSVCDAPGYLPDVLGPLVSDRAELKAERHEVRTRSEPGRTGGGASTSGAVAPGPDEPDAVADRLDALDGQISALKWILVSCFGYQGFSNAKFGRIECHEAINAYAREILLDAKARLEAGGWRVLHGVVDSLWVTARPDREQTPLSELAATVSADADIDLEYETAYDWFAVCPLRDSDAGALTRYFGRERDGGYTYRGIECRQRSTCPFVAAVQRALIERFDATRTPETVCARLAAAIRRLRAGEVDPRRLVERARVSQPVDAYDHYTRTAAALDRAGTLDRDHPPGTDVTFVVVDDDAATADRVALPSELADRDAPRYDVGYYRGELHRAAASVLGPLGWTVADVRAALADGTATTLDAYG
jgi:DNA polymerase I